jgi:hypothetical protein
MSPPQVLPSHRPVVPFGTLAAIFVFSCAMGWLEAVVVVYIRALLGIAHAALPPSPAILFERLHSLPWLLPSEQIREVTTLVMLGVVGWIAGRSPRGRWGAFLISFGVWDIMYYVALFALVRWPTSLATMDLLFLIPPGPWWYQPVWVPIAVSCAMIGLGLRLARR